MTNPSDSAASTHPSSAPLRPRPPPPSVLTAIQTLGMDKSLLNTTLRTKAGERRLHQNLFYERMRQRKEEEERRRRQNCFVPLQVIEFMACGSGNKRGGGFGCSDGDESIGGHETKISSISGLDVVDKEIQRLEAARLKAQELLQESETQLKLLQKAKTEHTPQQAPPSIATPSAAMGAYRRSPQSLQLGTKVPPAETSTAENIQRSQPESKNDSSSKRLFTLERQVINQHEQQYQALLDNHQKYGAGDAEGPGTVVLNDDVDVTPQVWSPAQQASFLRKNQMYRDLRKPIDESIELLKAPSAVEPPDDAANDASPASVASSDASNSIVVTVDDKSSDEVEVEIPPQKPTTPTLEETRSQPRPDPAVPLAPRDRNGQRRPDVAALVDLDSGCDEASTIVGPMENSSSLPSSKAGATPDARIHAAADAVEVTCDSPVVARSAKQPLRKSHSWDISSAHYSMGKTIPLTGFALISPAEAINRGAMNPSYNCKDSTIAHATATPLVKIETAPVPLGSVLVDTQKQQGLQADASRQTRSGENVRLSSAEQGGVGGTHDPATVPVAEHHTSGLRASKKPSVDGVKHSTPVATRDIPMVQTKSGKRLVQQGRDQQRRTTGETKPKHDERKSSSPETQYVPMVQGFSFHSTLSDSRVVIKGEPVSPNTVTTRTKVRASGGSASRAVVNKTPASPWNEDERSHSVSSHSVQEQKSIRSQRSNRIEEARAAFDYASHEPRLTCAKVSPVERVAVLPTRAELHIHTDGVRDPAEPESLRLAIDNDDGSLAPSPRHVIEDNLSPDNGSNEKPPHFEGRRDPQNHVESRHDESVERRGSDGVRARPTSPSHAPRPRPETLQSPSSKMSAAASRLLEHQIYAAQASAKQPATKPKEREFNKLKHLLDQIDYHHHQLHQPAPGSSDEVAGLVVAFGAPKSNPGRSRASRGQNQPPTQPTSAPALDPPCSSYEGLLRDHHKLCESPPSRASSRVARLETLRRSLEILDDTQPTQPSKTAPAAVAPVAIPPPHRHQQPGGARASRTPGGGRRPPLDASPTASPRRPVPVRPAALSPTTTDDWDLLMQVRAAILGGETSPIFGSESERVVLWPSK